MKLRVYSVLIGCVVVALQADPKMVDRGDLEDFYLSDHLKEEIKAEIMADMNLSFEGAKADLYTIIQAESERHRMLYTAQTDELSRQMIKLREELDFLRELVVDANYQRNSNDDVVIDLRKRFETIENRLDELIKSISDNKGAPEAPAGGRKL
ncbi:MAG: hypothetical protein LBN32_00550 [Helicobacteraceae bacterium]|jgi:hypothetical protein|nr:hypothetical protein [Helicobacteraceae bacterium]